VKRFSPNNTNVKYVVLRRSFSRVMYAAIFGAIDGTVEGQHTMNWTIGSLVGIPLNLLASLLIYVFH
jgi:hypothetical protein